MSKENKWTPGPWLFNEESWCEGHGDINSNYWMSLACVVTHNEHGELMRNGEGVANAHLIAAAPELYEALNYALQIGLLGGDTETFIKAEAALAKARGES